MLMVMAGASSKTSRLIGFIVGSNDIACCCVANVELGTTDGKSADM
jgi:hypothetical protein